MPTILNETALSFGDRVRVWPEVRAVQVAGELRLVPDVVSVKTQAGEAYLIQSGSEWIIFAPKAVADRNAVQQAKIREVADSWHFGPLLDPALLGPDTLQYEITHSNGVSYDGAKKILKFDHAPDLGLSLRQWERSFGGDLTYNLETGSATLELAALKADPDVDTVNLDPEIVTKDLVSYKTYLTDDVGATPDWDTVHDATYGDEAEAAISPGAGYIQGCTAWIRRSILEFVTSGMPTPKEAYVYAHSTAMSANALRLIGSDGSTYAAPLSDTINYSLILSMIAAHTIGTTWTNPTGDWWKSPDIVSAGEWFSKAPFDLALMEYAHDYLDVQPDNNVHPHPITATGADAPYLEAVYPFRKRGTSTLTMS